MALLDCIQIADGQHVEVNTPNGTIQCRGVALATLGAVPAHAAPTLPEMHVVSVSLSATIAPGKTLWVTGSTTEDLTGRPELDAIACPARPLFPGLVLMGAAFDHAGVHVGFANLSDAPITVSESMRVLLVP